MRGVKLIHAVDGTAIKGFDDVIEGCIGPWDSFSGFADRKATVQTQDCVSNILHGIEGLEGFKAS